ncbi:hypothetical protein GCM10010841_14720 [Deinococcus aerophilus]|uniref:Uncharacterized protein n=1 Tax=Deinococcus aerophilus TaxID=522488 RepID=A0ABQ2GR01_9DEIO|nr:hypothetical protein GCM10010841_14720 [Deinococcus aerophilus]
MQQVVARQPVLARAEGRQFGALGIGNRDTQHPATPVDQHADLAADVTRQFSQRAGEFGSPDPARLDTAAVQVAQGFQLCRAQARGIAMNFIYMESHPFLGGEVGCSL